MIGHLVYLYLLSPWSVLFNELEELDEIVTFDLAHASEDEAVPLERAIAEIEQKKIFQKFPSIAY